MDNILIEGRTVGKSADELIKMALEQPGVELIMATYYEAEEILCAAQQCMVPIPACICTTSDRSD